MDQYLKNENSKQDEHKRELFTYNSELMDFEEPESKFAELFTSKKEVCEKFEHEQTIIHQQTQSENRLNSSNTMQKHKSPNEVNANLIDPNLPQYNILLLGETGAGKSTTINALANYVQYASFDLAAKAKFVELISSSFKLTDPKTGKDFLIKSGDDDNECHNNVGASTTQEPMAYQFVYQDKLVRIIDTPGMGDTRGMMVDKKNFDSILNYLTAYKELHAILVLIKANEVKETASFRYCITELLTRLHRNACKNIIFCFTFSRNTHYGPGDGFVMLQKFLKEELPDVDIKLSNAVNCFFIDNEAYRYLIAKKCKFPFEPNHVNSYKESWNKSAAQTSKMIEQILELCPHNLEETLELNQTGKLIVKLAQPLIRLQINLNQNRMYIWNVRNKFQNSIKSMDILKNPEQTMEILQNVLNVNLYDLAINLLEFPVTVCTSSKCVQRINLGNQDDIHYSTHCHECCTEIEMDVDTIGHDLMRNCTAMAGTSKCKSCGCSWKEHMQLTVEYRLVAKTLIDSQGIEETFNQQELSKKVETLSGLLKQLQDDYVVEFSRIQEICAIFGYFLEKYSNTTFNRLIDPHLDMLILEEEKKIQRNKKHFKENHRPLLNLKKLQVSKMEEIKEKINSPLSSKSDYGLSDVKKLCDLLIGQKINGMKIKQIIEAYSGNNQDQQQRIERVAIDLRSTINN